MKKKFILTISVFTLCIFYAQAQDNNQRGGFDASFGASVNYYYGQGDRNFEKFENDRLNGQLNGMLGITLARDRTGRRTMIAAFGSYGLNNAHTTERILNDQEYTTSATEQGAANNFYQLEGGVLIADIFRISTGIGQQNFNSQTIVSLNNGIQTDMSYLKYHSTTVGFNFNIGSVAWVLNCNFAYGKDYNKTVITSSTGLMFHL